ncbi:hypothetical protein A2331_06645 [Candidatus Falkowbacteria bacterium RIFOXYB2_FULL_34_18]|uniref:PrgI family protein n=1 Tax=Candidatus Falkowbacteria bacterium RIFOXYD2_FULL_34_120 TaxID=1798007 RepID=A0A1F5TRC0_9BACT|nr:MAG: hypothetical protein A2331_06645 [Candidatus Falkowbacteria bacterium RIFOXYB2_FULL_34_18]OGF30001.1 MAG: hypothetical protein A2500_04035 [Candidatus Falkowbacteria bacterium RIFOXYC12_FULL_34_55]OGF37142.1 MAG: hypothetical protein A2466_02485 [Candidatus Falkowbacteria bacterium RIFOXYC2_FULL_34_220]OGF39537.1 MAG: hypothetical protein A2515_04400 [Candidatus Falkowbacteria bacterium RIFOXYD12_FULL_34_57]OGF41480.1 MAG: hypothetical protein A2531_02200 [Candidatus Falkowbacteria bact
MQQFTVPQFIDVEDKIIGPITTRQFLIMLAGCMLVAILYKLLDFTAFLTFSVLIFAVFGSLAFFKINGMAMHFFILNFLETLRKAPKRVWDHTRKKEWGKEIEDDIKIEIKEIIPVKEFSGSRLGELSLIVDTRGMYRGEGREKVKELDL